MHKSSPNLQKVSRVPIRCQAFRGQSQSCQALLDYAKGGIKFVGEDAVSCRNIVLTTIPNQVIPHTHKLK